MAARVFTDSGLSHAQITALAAVACRRRLHWGWILAFSLVVVVGAGWYENWKYGKPPTVSLSYLLCLGLFWMLPARTAGWGAASGIVTGLVRLLFVKPIGRERPSNFAFAQPMEPIFGATSFPSGHATTSFAIAVFLFWATRNRGENWLGWAALAWAAAVGLSRVYVGVHYPLDVMAGAALGAIGGSLVWLLVSGWLDRSLEGGQASAEAGSGPPSAQQARS